MLSGRTGSGKADDGKPADTWEESATHEGCMLFGYVDVSRAPGTLHFAPVSPRHSFDFSHVNTSHHIDHLSFGLELASSKRAALPNEVRRHLLPLDGRSFFMRQPHETREHHVNIVPTKYQRADASSVIEAYQFTATSHGRTRDTLPSVLISYDVSPIQVEIEAREEPLSAFLVSLCAIVGGAVSLFGIFDGILFTSAAIVKERLGKQS